MIVEFTLLDFVLVLALVCIVGFIIVAFSSVKSGTKATERREQPTVKLYDYATELEKRLEAFEEQLTILKEVVERYTKQTRDSNKVYNEFRELRENQRRFENDFNHYRNVFQTLFSPTVMKLVDGQKEVGVEVGSGGTGTPTIDGKHQGDTIDYGGAEVVLLNRNADVFTRISETNTEPTKEETPLLPPGVPCCAEEFEKMVEEETRRQQRRKLARKGKKSE